MRVGWYAVGLRRAVAEDDLDVVLCMNGMGRPGVPHVNLVQQAMLFAERELRRPASFAVKLAGIAEATRRSCQAAAVVVQTGWMRANLMEYFGLAEAHVLPLGLPERPARRSTHRAQRMLLVTSEWPYKNAHVVKAAFDELRREFPRLRLDVVGARWDAAGVDVHPEMTPDELFELYEEAALVVVPSLIESLGLPLVEAMAVACPVVAADRAYARDVCDNAAMYFEPESVDDLVRVAGEVLRDAGLSRNLAERGVRRFERLRAMQPVRRLADLLVEVA
jgi:glycosyltransferase involved in cell wall biosynthesis